MLITKFVTVKPELAHSRTYEDFSKFLGVRPERLGLAASLYPEHTASFLTEQLMNVWYNNKGTKSKFQSINAFMFEWDIDVAFIKRIEFARDVDATDQMFGQEWNIPLQERYYEKNDTFKIEGSKQTMFVLTEPVRNTSGYYDYHCQLIDADYASTLDLNSCRRGMKTLFISNYQPEYHSKGYTKYQSNIEKHRNYISLHRNDITFSAQFAAMEDVFISIGKGDENGIKKEAIFKMNKKESDVLESFLFARNNALLFGKCNFDKNGKCTVIDTESNAPIPMGDGIISQVERFAPRYIFSTLTTNVFETALMQMSMKSAKPTGNTYVFVCNERMYHMVQRNLREYMKSWQTTGTFMFNQVEGREVEVGATYSSYIYAGNKITFQVDRALSREYPDKAYGVFLDLSADKASGRPAIQMFTFKGGEFITNKLKGVGGITGLESGEVYSPVAGSALINWGYAGVGVFAPYRSYIIEEA